MTRLVVVSNRVSVPRGQRTPQAGGLAVALSAALAEYGGTWFGWDGRITESVPDGPTVTEAGDVRYATTPLSQAEHDTYYAGFSNEVLWPLCHFMLDRMHYRADYHAGYWQVNQRFARQLAPMLTGNDLIWVHDYHLVPLAHCLRAHRVRQPIGFFLHIPFPSFGLLRAMPGWREWLDALADYDLIGVQTPEDARALRTAFVYGMGAESVDNEVVRFDGRQLRIIALPVGIEVHELARMAEETADSRRVQRLLASLGPRTLIIGVERLDYSKGLPERLSAYEKLLENFPGRRGHTVLMQIASPSRGSIQEYQALQEELEAMAGHINGTYADFDWMPVRYLHKTFARGSLLGFFRTARVGLVTPLRDGMNLVAKEYVAAQNPDDPGVLVLSELAGAAQELEAAIQVNPYDTDGMAKTLERALSLPIAERQDRWQDMIRVLRENDLVNWRRRYVEALRTQPHYSMGNG